jgi:hypothetical protein
MLVNAVIQQGDCMFEALFLDPGFRRDDESNLDM